MENLKANWRTTVAGAVCLACAVLLFIFGVDQDAKTHAGTLAIVGVGLLAAKDA